MRSDEDGVALVVVTIVAVLLLLGATTLVTVASHDVLATRRSAVLLAARDAAESALEVVASDPAAMERFAREAPTWTTVDGFGRLVPCGAADVCARVAAREVEVPTGATERRVRAVVVEATGRAGCRGERCTRVKVQQRVERRTALDFLLQTDRELADPDLLAGDDAEAQRACVPLLARERSDRCVVPVWFGRAGNGDRATGPVHTNDDLIPICGSPGFDGPVETTKSSWEGEEATLATTFLASSGPGCSGTPVLGPGAVLRTAPRIALPPDVRHLEPIASDGRGLHLTGAEVHLSLLADGRVQVGSDVRPGPDSGVVFVDAPRVHVRGSTPFPITIATTGTLVIDGDIGTTADAVPDAAVGLVADGFVELAMADRHTATVTDRHLRRVALVSLAHTVHNPRWDDTSVCRPTCPALHLEGAIAGRFRPLIGSYGPDDAALVGGYRKELRHLPAFADVVPPYLLSPAATTWRRADAVEAGGGTAGLVTDG